MDMILKNSLNLLLKHFSKAVKRALFSVYRLFDGLFVMVEMRGIEPLSEKILPRFSPSAVGVLNLPRCIAHQQAMHFGSS
jgi:hypothetical protein